MPAKAVAKGKNNKKTPAVSVQSAGPGMMFSKASFFVPKRGPDGGRVAIPASAAVPDNRSFNNHRQPCYTQQRRFVYDKSTGEAYAEWIDGVAVCVHTGQELFRSRSLRGGGDDDFVGSTAPASSFDFSVPKQRHPNDFSISTEDVVASGFLTLADFKAPDGAAIRLADYELYLKRKEEEESGARVLD
jgi:hypothetical protein